MSINVVTITGNLTRDCELRTSKNGTAVALFNVAVNDRRKNREGDWEDYPNFIDCKLFGGRADSLAQYLIKGCKVAVTGKLHQARWENNGKKNSKIEVEIDNIDLCGGRQSKPQADDEDDGYYDEDIPF